METALLEVTLNGTLRNISVRELTEKGDVVRRFEVKDPFSFLIMQKGTDGKWTQSTTVPVSPENLELFGQAINRQFDVY